MLDFLPKLTCSYCDMTLIINQEKYHLQVNSLYHYFLMTNTYNDFSWRYNTFPCDDNADECYVHVACPKCIVESGDYNSKGWLKVEAELRLLKEFNKDCEQENE